LPQQVALAGSECRNDGVFGFPLQNKTMVCSSVAVEMAEFLLVFSQIFWKHFRSSQTTVHPVGSLS